MYQKNDSRLHNNRKSLEPSNIALSWIHMDVRNYSSNYLDDKYFVKGPVDNLWTYTGSYHQENLFL